MNVMQNLLVIPEASSAASPIRVAIVEDDDLVRESLAVLIGGAAGFACVGAYPSGEQALEQIHSQIPDVVLMDIHLPKMSGIECVRGLKEQQPKVQIVMLTMYEDDKLVFDSLCAGASGFLLKRTPHVQILAAIQDIHQGGSPMTSSIARKVVQLLRQPSPRVQRNECRVAELKDADPPLPRVTGNSLPPRLSPRETEILALLAKGYRYKEIANTLGINIETVRTHLRRIYDKLQVSSRTEAVVR